MKSFIRLSFFAYFLHIEKELSVEPLFTIMNEYIGGRVQIYHFDMYRLSSMDEAVELGFMQYFDMNELDGISLVEWPQNVEGLFPKEAVHISILKTDIENQRRIVVG